MMSKWIFESIFVIIYPKNSCDSRAPLGLPRPHGGSTPFPHNRPTICRRRTGADERLGERGPPGEGSALSPGWRIIVNAWNIIGELSVDPSVARNTLRSSTGHWAEFFSGRPGPGLSPPAIVPNITRRVSRSLFSRCTAPPKGRDAFCGWWSRRFRIVPS